MSHLASVQLITNLSPIENADQIEVADILGWKVVVKKDEFKIGDLVGYIQIDTVVPETEQFEFLRPRDFRVRTIKLRKQVSQGLIVPLPEGKWKEGDDITDVLGVKKFSKDNDAVEERPKKPKNFFKKMWYIFKYNVLVKVFPNMKKFNRVKFPKNLISITDEERIQNMPQILERYKGKLFVIAEKLDGSSITIIHEKKKRWFKKPISKYRICSRRFELFNTNNDWHKVFYDTNFQEHIQKLVTHYKTDNIIVQGEFIGKPQGNPYQLVKNEIRLFNIQVNGKKESQENFYIACSIMDIPCCPLIDIRKMDFDLPGILKFAEGKSSLNEKTEREGLVFRCVGEPSVSFKVISNKFLLKNNE